MGRKDVGQDKQEVRGKVDPEFAVESEIKRRRKDEPRKKEILGGPLAPDLPQLP